LSSSKCTWYFAESSTRSKNEKSQVLQWNIQPETDYEDAALGLFGYVSIESFNGGEKAWEVEPSFEAEADDADQVSHLDDHNGKKVKFGDASSQKSSIRNSVASEDLFAEGKDDILFQGELMKFKPGISANFVNRYVQISLRAFRYFRNHLEAKTGNPIVAIRKNII